MASSSVGGLPAGTVTAGLVVTAEQDSQLHEANACTIETVRFTLLDGGLSTALERAGHDLNHPLWTARLLVDEPEAIVAAHLAYLEAGAEVLITASYQASRVGLEAAGVSYPAVLQLSTELAREAVRRTGRPALVGASVGPYGAVLADGSEYRGRYELTFAQLVDFHRERLAALLPSEPDLLVVETLPTATEASAIVEALAGCGLPVWFSFTCRDGELTWGGDRIEDAARAALGWPGTTAVGVNCTAPNHVASLLGRLSHLSDLPLIAYPNLGQFWLGAGASVASAGPLVPSAVSAVSSGGVWRGDGRPLSAELIGQWVAAGAAYVGGCCGFGPAEIAQLATWRNP